MRENWPKIHQMLLAQLFTEHEGYPLQPHQYDLRAQYMATRWIKNKYKRD